MVVVGVVTAFGLVVSTPAVAAESAGAAASGSPAPAAPTLRMLDLSPSSLSGARPRASVAAPEAAAGEDGPLVAPASGMAWYVETPAEDYVGDGLTLEGEGVVHYPADEYGAPPQSAASTRVLRQGSPVPGDDGGCTFAGDVVLNTPAEVTMTELSYDGDRCLSLVEVGVTPGATNEEPEPEGSTGGSESAPQEEADSEAPTVGSDEEQGARGAAARGDVSTAAVRSFRARTRSQVREPAYPALPATSEVFANVNVYNGNPQHAPTTASYNWSMLTRSGWYQTSFDWSKAFTYNYARSTVTAKFRNDVAGRVLCGILWGSTYASHAPTEVRGYRNGTAQYSTNTTKSGNCSFLLRTDQTENYDYL